MDIVLIGLMYIAMGSGILFIAVAMISFLWMIIRAPIIMFSPKLEGRNTFLYTTEDPGFFGFYDRLMLDEPKVAVILDTKKERFNLKVKLTKTDLAFHDTYCWIPISLTDIGTERIRTEAELVYQYKSRIDGEIKDLLADLKKNRKKSEGSIKKHVKKDMTKLYEDLRKADSL